MHIIILLLSLPIYKELKKLMVGLWLKVERRIDLVYGGGSVGLMGLVSQAVHHGGRHVLGFAPFLSLFKYIQHTFTHLYVFTYLLCSCDMMHLLVPSTPLLIIVFLNIWLLMMTIYMMPSTCQINLLEIWNWLIFDYKTILLNWIK